MKKLIIISLAFCVAAVMLPAKEYSYLDPPTISVMDFEVNIEEPLVSGTPVSKEYFGQLINHTLVTVLIQKNNEFGLVIPGHPHYNALNYADSREGFEGPLKTDAEFFPPLLKIYDKKYVETALRENNFTVNDLYTKSPEAFNFPDLDFVVLGNVFRYQGDKIALNVRVLNTYRGEELFAYSEFIDEDMSGLYEVCDLIAHQILIDILTNYCSQVLVKSIKFVNPNQFPDLESWAAEQARWEGENPYQLFYQSRQEKDNTDEVITANDTFKKKIVRDRYYFMLPGNYVLSVYNEDKQSVQEIPVELKPREIKVVQLKTSHLDTVTGSITIENWKPTDAYRVEIVELERDAKYLWEVGNDMLGDVGEAEWRNFRDGDVEKRRDVPAGAEGEGTESPAQTVWLYNAARQELSISRLPLMKYSVRITPLPDNISKEDIFGILRVSSRAIESSDAVDADLRFEKDITLDIADFGVTDSVVSDVFQTTRVTFLIPEAFEMDTILFNYSESDREGNLAFYGYEKLVVEGMYTEEEWNDFISVQYTFNGSDNQGLRRTARLSLPKESIEAKRDSIYVIALRESSLSPFAIDTGEEEKKGLGGFLERLFGGNKDKEK